MSGKRVLSTCSHSAPSEVAASLGAAKLSRRRLLAGAGAAAAGGALLAASSHSTAFAQAKAAPSGQVIVGLSQEPTVFNPLMPGIEVDQGVQWNLYSPLWGVDQNGDFFPVLAKEVPSVENGGVTADGLTWKVTLRDDVKWHDGQPFSADDVKFTHDLIMNPKFRAASRVGHELVTDMTVVSPIELTWKMQKAFAPYFAVLAWTFIVPKHILGAVADPNTAPFNQKPVGTGAFMWQERVPGDHITLKANPNYFGEGPYLETIVFKYIPDLTVLFTQFQTGTVDYTGIQGITADHYSQAKSLADRQVVVGPDGHIEGIWFNLGKPQFQEQAVREALYYGMDKETIVKEIYYGLQAPSESYLPKQSWAFDPTLPTHEYNPTKAKQLLDAAGWKPGSGGIREKNGVRLSFSNSTTAGNHVREQAQSYLQQTWKEIGVEMTIKNMPAAVVWGSYWINSQYDTVMVGNDFMSGPDPDATIYFDSQDIPAKGGSGSNSMQYQNPKVDALLEQGARTVQREQRKPMYLQIQQMLRNDLPFLPIFQYATIEGLRAGLTGYTPNLNVLSNCWNMNTWKWQK